jgi:hypothetical protein
MALPESGAEAMKYTALLVAEIEPAEEKACPIFSFRQYLSVLERDGLHPLLNRR